MKLSSIILANVSISRCTICLYPQCVCSFACTRQGREHRDDGEMRWGFWLTCSAQQRSLVVRNRLWPPFFLLSLMTLLQQSKGPELVDQVASSCIQASTIICSVWCIKWKQTQVTESLITSKPKQNMPQATIMRVIVVHSGSSEKNPNKLKQL